MAHELTAICLKSLAREPEDRYPSAAALGEALDDWLERVPIRLVTVAPALVIVRQILNRQGSVPRFISSGFLSQSPEAKIDVIGDNRTRK